MGGGRMPPLGLVYESDARERRGSGRRGDTWPVLFRGFCGYHRQALGREDAVKRVEQVAYARVGQSVDDGLGVAPPFDYARLAERAKLLRERRLVDAELFLDFAHSEFAPTKQVGDQQPLRVPEKLEDFGNVGRAGLPVGCFFRLVSAICGLQAEVPIPLPSLGCRGFALRRHQGRGYEDRIAGTPSFRREHVVLIAGLQCRDESQQFLHAASDIHRIPGDRPYHPFRVDHERCAHRGAGVSARMEHAVGSRHGHRGVLDNREGTSTPKRSLMFATQAMCAKSHTHAERPDVC